MHAFIYLKVAQRAIKLASEIIMKYYSDPRLTIKNTATKRGGVYDWVTSADLEAEKAIMEIINHAFPRHSIRAEESEYIDRNSQYTWYIDPLSNTTNFVHKIPHFASIIGLTYKDEPIVGVITDPYYQEIYYAEKGKGAWCRKQKLKVSTTKQLSRAAVAMQSKKDNDKLYRRIISSVDCVRFFGSSGVHVAHCAMGRFDAFINRGLDIRSHVAAVVIAREAGAKVTNFIGNRWSLADKDIVITNKFLHSSLLKMLR